MSRKPGVKILASAKISDKAAKTVLLDYCKGVAPAEAARHSGLSHVTVYRLYRYARERLIALAIYPTLSTFKERIEEQRQEDAYFAAGPRPDLTVIETAIRAHRGVHPANREAYRAEKIYQQFQPWYTPGQLNRFLLLSARLHGPLNRPPVVTDNPAFHQELARILVDQIERSLRGHQGPDEAEDEPTTDMLARIARNENRAYRDKQRKTKSRPRPKKR